jgi:hypothetical protein
VISLRAFPAVKAGIVAKTSEFVTVGTAMRVYGQFFESCGGKIENGDPLLIAMIRAEGVTRKKREDKCEESSRSRNDAGTFGKTSRQKRCQLNLSMQHLLS